MKYDHAFLKRNIEDKWIVPRKIKVTYQRKLL